ncbi:hypothetical protein FVEG_10846 [Fusarium verticillioides 7600]|uniref:Uncharacterized protein n=1 Tax=Gibberella moniliformis (strain M3125 / FGSC 7600) TaxID=334819 RepID=W7N5W0_GIBM7|nr:hypothetical protein FVEG_10846 [Fusarium verticillioides 7600]EWG52012.1 hypothetical protein FVEG_10846 [Fusarium verticillioides 7600]
MPKHSPRWWSYSKQKVSTRVRQIVREEQISSRCTIKQKYGVIVPNLRYYGSQHLPVDLRFRKEINALPLRPFGPRGSSPCG